MSEGRATALQHRDGARPEVGRFACVAALITILVVGAFFRLYGLGSRSLWADEFCTWHVSRMDLGESLRWGPELTKPPLYQLFVRLMTNAEKPPEWVLRMPACAAGVLVIPAAFFLMRLGGDRISALAACALLATSGMQIRYSQEARPYSLWVLWATISTICWHGVVTRHSWRWVVGYAIATALSFYTNYLTSLVFGSHLLWWILRSMRPDGGAIRRPLAAVLASLGLCAPMVVHYLRYRSSVFQGLSWIPPATWGSAVEVLGRITLGPGWVVGVLGPALAYWAVCAVAARFRRGTRNENEGSKRGIWLEKYTRSGQGAGLLGLLGAWLCCGWLGLLVISWLAHPAMVDRYALSVGVPGVLLPLMMAARIDRRLPALLAIVFAALGARNWSAQTLQLEPGFRELSQYLAEVVDPERELIVLTIDRRTHPDWTDAEQLPFQYYPVAGHTIHDLHLDVDGVTPMNDVLDDPRAAYLVVLWSEPFAILAKAGRESVPIEIEGTRYTQLLFSPYRLVKVAERR